MDYEKPDKVKKAQLNGDKEVLRRMGRKGGKVAAESKAFAKERRAETELEEKKEHLYRELLAEHGEERADEIMRELEGRN